MSQKLQQAIKSIINEAVSSRASVERDIQAAASSLFGDVFKTGTASRRGEIRLQPKDSNFKLTDEQVKKLLALAKHPLVSIIMPNEPDSKSGKFKTFVTKSGYAVVVAGGGNLGQTREITLTAELQEVAGGNAPSEHLADLLDKLNILPEDIQGAELASAKRVKRPISTEVKNVGEVISDVTITLTNGEKVYISLKVNPSGGGGGLSLINIGYSNSFEVDTTAGTVKPKSHPYDSILAAVGLSKAKIAKGLQSILRAEPMKNVTDNSPKFDVNALKSYLSSAYGYGYWYVKESKKGWEVIDLTTEEKLDELVGEPTVESVVYPGMSVSRPGTASSRSRSVVNTTVGRKYEFVVRNTEGKGLNPNKILVDVK